MTVIKRDGEQVPFIREKIETAINAAFIDAFNYFGNNIVINGLNNSSLQSDKMYKKCSR